MLVKSLTRKILQLPETHGSFVTMLYSLCKLTITVRSAGALVTPEIFLVATTDKYLLILCLPMVVLLCITFTRGSGPAEIHQ